MMMMMMMLLLLTMLLLLLLLLLSGCQTHLAAQCCSEITTAGYGPGAAAEGSLARRMLLLLNCTLS
jgi:hypothetical protein